MNEEIKKCYDLLGLKTDASDEEVYDACGFMAHLYKSHPNLATTKIKEINDAYDKIMASRQYEKMNADKTTNYDAVIETKQEILTESTDEEIKICPFCAEKIKSEAKKCRYCGEWLNKKDVTTLDKNVSDSTISRSTKPSSSQQRTIATPFIAKAKVTTKNLYEAYLGKKNSFYYANIFLEFDKHPNEIEASWNWGAFFGNFFWALYRKMYGWFFALLMLSVVLLIIDIALRKSGYHILSFLVWAIPALVFGYFANSIYYRNVKKEIAEAQLVISDESRLLEYLRGKGVVNRWVIQICIALLALLYVALIDSFLAGPLSGGEIFLLIVICGVPIVFTIAILYANINIDWEMKLRDIWSKDSVRFIVALIIIVLVIIIYNM